MTGNKEDTCLYFEEYVRWLLKYKKMNEEYLLNEHIQPQRLFCQHVQQLEKDSNETNVIHMKGNISQVFTFFRSLSDFDFQDMNEIKMHSYYRETETFHDKDMAMLCKVAEDDYLAMKLQVPENCRKLLGY